MGGGGRAGGWSRCSHGRLEGGKSSWKCGALRKAVCSCVRVCVAASRCGPCGLRSHTTDGWSLQCLWRAGRGAAHRLGPSQPPAVPGRQTVNSTSAGTTPHPGAGCGAACALLLRLRPNNPLPLIHAARAPPWPCRCRLRATGEQGDILHVGVHAPRTLQATWKDLFDRAQTS